MNPDYPFAEVVESPNYGYPRGASGRQGNAVKAIVFHIAQGSAEAVCNYFRNPAPGGRPDDAVSAHFLVTVSGHVIQFVALADAAWGNGIVEPGARWATLGLPAVNPNLLTVSIEHEGFSGEPLPFPQVLASLELTEWLVRRFGLVPSTNALIRHSDIAPHTRGACPGPAFPYVQFVELLAKVKGG